jgi:hypothetical protein
VVIGIRFTFGLRSGLLSIAFELLFMDTPSPRVILTIRIGKVGFGHKIGASFAGIDNAFGRHSSDWCGARGWSQRGGFERLSKALLVLRILLELLPSGDEVIRGYAEHLAENLGLNTERTSADIYTLKRGSVTRTFWDAAASHTSS